GTRPRDGLKPYTPQNEAGIRTEPPASVPSATGPRPLATATAAPPLEPPGESSRFHGVRVVPQRGLSGTALWPNSDVVVFPRMTAPAARSRPTTTASSSGTASANSREPPVVRRPRVKMTSLIDSGTPCRAPNGSALVTAITASRAPRRARSWATRQNALRRGFSASIRASTASVSSTGEICFDRMRAASSVAGRHTNSSTFLSINALYHSASWTLAGRPSVSEARRLRSRTSWRSPKSWPSSDTVRRCATGTLRAGAACWRSTATAAAPARLPAGAGAAVVNAIASLARDQGRDSLRYGGPYPTEQLFTTLLDSFHYDTTRDDPLAAFSRGELAWRPAPHERVFTPEGACVYLRERVEKVAWRSRVYQRPNAQGIGRHAAYRVRDTGGRVV